MSTRSRKPAKKPKGVETFSIDFVAGPSRPKNGVTTAQSLSKDRRRVRRSEAATILPSPQKKRKTLHDNSSADGEFLPPFNIASWVGSSHDHEDDFEEVPPVDVPPPKQARRRKYNLASDEPLRIFRQFHADEFAEELVRGEGRGAAGGCPCPSCPAGQSNEPRFRCKTCFSEDLYCKECFLADHARRPFCRVEEWNGTSFEKRSLQSMGASIQLGHTGGEPCPLPVAVQEFTVIHVNGLHTCTVKFCGCKDAEVAGTHCQQLLRSGLFPATTREPQTACTFEVLRHFQSLSLQGKVSLYDYYSSLEKLTDATAMWEVKDRYKSFMRCVREWKYLQQLKHAGRMNYPDERPSKFSEGELAVNCPACPRPGINIPDNWKDAPDEMKFCYTLFLALDACFRLKRRRIGSKERDPPLIDGGTYMVRSDPFEDFLQGVTEQTEINTCTGLSAIDHANTKYNKGYAETGKVLGLCARHEFVQKTGVVPTQVGERYANTDYALGSLLRFHANDLPLVLSYDICCQYSRNLKERLRGINLPEGLRIDLTDREIRFVIPKLHIHGHQLLCQLLYNLNYTGGVGRTDGEGVERPWGVLGPLGTSLRAMGPGSAADTLDDHIGFWNFCKLVALGLLLRRRFLVAVKEFVRQNEDFKKFTQAQQEQAVAWSAMVIAFEKGLEGAPNPFALPKSGVNEADVALELATEDEQRARQGTRPRNDMSAGQFVLAALAVEDEQRVLRLDVAGKKYNTTSQLTELAQKRTKLRHTLVRLAAVQATYIPATSARPGVETRTDVAAEDMPLGLPSTFTMAERAVCLDDVVDIERRLRDAQCRTSLEAIRNHLLVKQRLLTYKTTNVRNQGPATRARTILANNDAKVTYAAHKYIDARAALVRLADGNESAVQWHTLDVRKDIRCMEEDESAAQAYGAGNEGGPGAQSQRNAGGHLQQCRNATGEGRRTMSWIWRDVDTSSNGEGTRLYEGLRVEYCKAFARVRRWGEEIPLLREEMRRTLASLAWTATQWESRAQRENRAGPLGEGARAYANKQARIYRNLGAHFSGLWGGLLEDEEGGWNQSRVQELEAIVAAQEADGEEGVEEEVDIGGEVPEAGYQDPLAPQWDDEGEEAEALF